DGERLARARPRDDAEPPARGREATDVVAVLAGEQRVDLEAHRQLDCLARGTGGGDHDHAPGRGLGGEEGGRIGGKEVIARQAYGRNIERRQTKSGRRARLPLHSSTAAPSLQLLVVAVVPAVPMVVAVVGPRVHPSYEEQRPPVAVEVRAPHDDDRGGIVRERTADD